MISVKKVAKNMGRKTLGKEKLPWLWAGAHNSVGECPSSDD